MAERLTLGIFLAAMLVCLLFNLNVAYGLLVGLGAFFCYARQQGLKNQQILRLMWSGLHLVVPVLIILLSIGVLASAWRASGTIPFLVYQSASIIRPNNFLLICFLLCCLMSMLMGSSLGTAGTVGVICMMLGQALGVNPLFTGGAVLAGSYFGDRGSPMSSSAHLICTVTKTNIYQHVVMVAKSGGLAFLLSILIYWLLGSRQEGLPGAAAEVVNLFNAYYQLSWWAAIPGLIIIIFSLLRINVRHSILTSALAAYLLAIFLQGSDPWSLLLQLFAGYQVVGNETLAQLMNGGGLVSMLPAVIVVSLASSYFGIFRETPLLDGVKQGLLKLTKHISPFGTSLTTALFTATVCCNQSLPIMLTDNIFEATIPDNRQRALALANTATVVAPLIPWNVAALVPLLAIGASAGSILFAFYLYLVPLFSLSLALWQHYRAKARGNSQNSAAS